MDRPLEPGPEGTASSIPAGLPPLRSGAHGERSDIIPHPGTPYRTSAARQDFPFTVWRPRRGDPPVPRS